MSYPVLYSYRRCPYAMRARLAIYFSALRIEQREIVFWDKPEPMLIASPKATVPVLVLPNNDVIDESRDIMLWALQSAGRNEFTFADNPILAKEVSDWIDVCDNQFKPWLDKYKYADRHPEFSAEYYRQQGCFLLDRIEQKLAAYQLPPEEVAGLVNNQMSMADMATVTFIRQFANVDKAWFTQTDYPFLKMWLNGWLNSEAFQAVMKNRPVWQQGHNPLWVDEPGLQTKNQFSDKALA
ncbi:glutathione S-transferase [Thiomicrorhabdus sediminis]|uniref:Glutathione S-transferase n=2 Tax=Thiomicrorhabdus sediminis TaxID=2580412 RepID=A0A4P9K7H4_9GAMM|nr:glutathione S-transferase [Thiomicrorhabdus sediminis]